MGDSVCRAFTFINYHIPLSIEGETPVEYITLGFFDGMFSEKLQIDYENQDLKALWKYTLKRTQKNRGNYSYQHIFGFTENTWSGCSDDEFWDDAEEKNNPLVFIVLLQIRQYMSGVSGEKTIEEQCREFVEILNENLNSGEKYIVYGTIDKNDYIVCIRGRKHTDVLRTIQRLHNIKNNVIYSYSILSVKREIIEEMTREQYPDIYSQYIDSICLKGITNSRKLEKNISLDKRYYDFCKNLIECIDLKRRDDYKIYDILGDEDFRLIAREVSLGSLLRQFAQDGLLGYKGKEFKFYLYSSSLVLNTLTLDYGFLSQEEKELLIQQSDEMIEASLCSALTQDMSKIQEIIDSWESDEFDEKTLTFCQALWQLLQSLKVLEMSPTKRYDFYSLYQPFSTMVHLLEEKLEKKEENIEDDKGIYDYINKINMTLQGSFRTDIQFFQVRDYNVMMHYTPAKLRAFYSYWTFEISNFYNSFSNKGCEYSFIFSSGMYRGVNVDELFEKEKGKRRIMLITAPERLIYTPKWILLSASHEVAHFVGGELRSRGFRQEAWVRIIARIIQLEYSYAIVKLFSDISQEESQEVIAEDESSFNEFSKKHLDVLSSYMEKECEPDCHKKATMNRIKKVLREYENLFLEKFIYDNVGKFKNALNKKLKKKNLLDAKIKNLISNKCQETVRVLRKMYEKFEYTVLHEVLEILHYYVSESQADIIAILSTGIGPHMYIQSFFQNDNINNVRVSEEGTIMVVVRIGIVMKVMEEVVREEQEWLNQIDKNFVTMWSEDIEKNTCHAFQKGSVEYNLAVHAFGYNHSIKDFQFNILLYKKLYNEDYNIQTFTNKLLDFVKDKYVYNELYEYGKSCASNYIEKIKRDRALSDYRIQIINTYKKISGNSATAAIQQMEKFLAEYEMKNFSSSE